ncbi:NADH-ubiquinone oxidoreductase B18 subunit-domain-containing protein [Cristinia sonorae]|uniref:NADH dehydrogenase [ubiquinone] 1 beta subcomplex subunit 7 n=1 Tax=Cristinia sonorae TaxID=1940300 RepID=A0A8K0UXN6_9AGAR|nr:NADH-ubiquinone oxidoreductase B18 subunit-domain-containing protein [Cristinia sonorae]
MSSSTTASQTELKNSKIPLAWRDGCSSLLLPLNVCRKDKFYLPWECENERHAYEKCQYDDYVRRMKKLSKLKLEQAEAEES